MLRQKALPLFIFLVIRGIRLHSFWSFKGSTTCTVVKNDDKFQRELHRMALVQGKPTTFVFRKDPLSPGDFPDSLVNQPHIIRKVHWQDEIAFSD